MSDENKPTVVIDTNLLISAIIIKGKSTPKKLLTAWREYKYHLVMSEDIFLEVEQVLKREKIYKKYAILPQEIDGFLTELHNTTIFINSLSLDLLPIYSRDKDDDKFIACALGGDVDYLITGDDDLLVLNGRPELGHLQILEAAAFLQKLG